MTSGNDSATGADLRAELAVRLDGWQPERIGTLLFVMRPGAVLLIHKRRGHGAGRINGPGGKVEDGESIVDCAVRETREETGVVVLDPVLAARLKFVERRGEQWLGYAFVATRFEGHPAETAEALPEWFALDAIPFERMWEDDRFWLPRILAGETVMGDFLFEDERLLAHDVRVVDPATLRTRG